MKRLYLFFILITSISSCNIDNKTNKSILSEWIGKNFIFPPNVQFVNNISQKEETLNLNKKFKLVTYIDSIGCIACKLKMHLWKDLIKEFENVSQNNISFVFIINSKDNKEINYILEESEFEYPVCFDKNDLFNKTNNFPKNIELQTFLLDKDNNVILVGNPLFSISIKNLYLRQISEKEHLLKNHNNKDTIITEIELGKFELTKKRNVTVHIHNNDNNPIVISNIKTTCKCTNYSYDRKPINKGDSTKIKITIEPISKGFFHESVTIKCSNKKTIKYMLKGNVY